MTAYVKECKGLGINSECLYSAFSNSKFFVCLFFLLLTLCPFLSLPDMEAAVESNGDV